MKTRRTDAKVSLMKLQQDQEKFRMNCPFYASEFVFPLPTPPVPTCDRTNNIYRLVSNSATALNSAPSADRYYTIKIIAPVTATPSGTAYTLQADIDPNGQQKKDTNCAKFTIDQNGNKLAFKSDNTANNDCWK